ncbi:MAG: hypothetical protein H3C43_07250 [Leptonema sp. (in: Bacteria)]|nr:hypothetical protein [Leptonema sp. (in: bacteria)]
MSRRLTTKLKPALYEIIQEIDESRIHNQWSIHLSTVLLAVDEKIETFYRFFYESKFSDIPDIFTEKNIELLIQFLNYVGHTNVEQEFRNRGLYLTNDDCLHWKELFLSVSLNYLMTHQIDESDLEISISGCKNLTDGFEFYCDLQCSVDRLVERATAIYCHHQSVPECVKPQLIRYIDLLFERGYLRKEFLYSDLYRRLHQVCTQQGWVNDVQFFEPTANSITEKIKSELMLLGFHCVPTKQELKDRYRTLLKENHPDIKKTKEATAKTIAINEAYTKVYYSLSQIE